MLSTESLARACARRPWRTVGAWVLAFVLAITTIVALLDLTSEGELTSEPESERGYEAIGSHFPPVAETQQVGFGVGIALLIDATIVRCVLVPSSMKLLGRWNWYLPSWLGWLPDPHVEHEAS